MSIAMTDRGAKHRCLNCQTAFYDLKRPKLVCPRCGVDQAEAALKAATPASKRKRKPAAKPARPTLALAPESHDDEVEEEEEDEAKTAASAPDDADVDDDDEDEDDAPDAD